jgi:hypothetical protein
MDERKWNLSIDGLIEDEAPPRINYADGKELAEALNPLMVGLATGTDHRDAKIALSHRLIDIHYEHVETEGPSRNLGLLSERILDRLVFSMIAASTGPEGVPNALQRLLSLRLKLPERPQKGGRDEVAYRKLLHVVAENPDIGKKKAGAIAKVSPNTAKKWMDEPEFQSTVEIIRKHSEGVR